MASWSLPGSISSTFLLPVLQLIFRLFRGLGLERIFRSFLKVYSDAGNLVLVLNTNQQDEVGVFLPLLNLFLICGYVGLFHWTTWRGEMSASPQSDHQWIQRQRSGSHILGGRSTFHHITDSGCWHANQSDSYPLNQRHPYLQSSQVSSYSWQYNSVQGTIPGSWTPVKKHSFFVFIERKTKYVLQWLYHANAFVI